MKKQRLTFLGLFALSLALAAPAIQGKAAVLHDTLAGTTTASWLVGVTENEVDPNNPGPPTTINQPADSFVVTGGSFLFDSMTLGLASTDILDLFGGGPGTDYSVRLWDDSGSGTPGTLLESFTVVDSASIVGDVVLSSVLHPLLSNGATYWVSAALTDDESHGLWRAVDVPTHGRATTFSSSEAPSWFATGSTDAFSLQITGTPVPEPASLALACVAMLLGSLKWLRQK